MLFFCDGVLTMKVISTVANNLQIQAGGGFISQIESKRNFPDSLFFVILSDLNQAVPNHLADESQTR